MKNTFYVPEDYYNNLKEERKPRKGDLLYTVTGSFGIPVVVDSNDRFCFQRHIAMIRPDNNKITSEFLYYWCLSPNAKMIADQVATGTAQRTVSLTSLRKFIIPIPSIKEQELLVSTLSTIEGKVNTLQQNYSRICDECDALKQAILRQVFE
jgi:type I restriction enzyme S subunit